MFDSDYPASPFCCKFNRNTIIISDRLGNTHRKPLLPACEDLAPLPANFPLGRMRFDAIDNIDIHAALRQTTVMEHHGNTAGA